MKNEKFIPSNEGARKSAKTIKLEAEKIEEIQRKRAEREKMELEKARKISAEFKNATTENLADIGTSNYDSALGGKEDLKGKNGIISEQEAEENRKWIEEQWKREKEEESKEVEEQWKELNTEEELKKVNKKKKTHAIGYLGSLASKAALGIKTSILPLFGIVAGQNAQAGEAPKVQDPQDFKNKIEATVNQEKEISEDTYFVNPNDLEGGDGDDDQEKLEEQQRIQDEKDGKVYDKWAEIFSQDKSKYATGEEAESLIRYSLRHIREMAPDEESLTRLLRNTYGGNINMTEGEFKDFYSFVHNGHPDGKDLDKEGVGQLQETINKLSNACIDQAQRPEDEATLKEAGEKNALMTEMLKSNAGGEFNQGKDKLAGVETTINTLQTLTLADLELIKQAPLGVTELEQQAPDLQQGQKIEMPEERGYTTITFENGFNFTPEHQRSFELFNEKIDGFGKIDNIKDFASQFRTNTFDRIHITELNAENSKYNGDSFDFDELDHLATGNYKIHVGGYDCSFHYERGEGGITKELENFILTYKTPNGNIEASFDSAVRNISNFDKNDPNSQGFTRDLVNCKINLFDELEMGFDIHKYETSGEVGGSINNFHIKTANGWTMEAEGFSGKYKTPTGEFDIEKMVEGILHNGGKITDLIDRVELRGKPVTIENPDGSMQMVYDGKDYLFVDRGEAYKISIKGGEFKMINEKGEGAVYHGGIGTYAKINGEGIAPKDLIDNLFNHGAEKLYSNSSEVGISLGGGFIELSTGEVTNNIDQATADKIGLDIDQTFQKIADKAEELTGNGNVKDMISKGVDFKNFALEETKGLMQRTKESGNIDMSNWSASVDFKTLADNFELIGKPDVASALKKIDVLFDVLSFTFDKVTINQNFIDKYEKAENKTDFFVDHLLGEKHNVHSKEDLLNGVADRAIKIGGAELLNLSNGEVESAINAMTKGSVEGVTISPEKISAFWAFNKDLNPNGNVFIHGSANLGEKDHDVFVNVLPGNGPQFDLGTKLGHFGSVGVGGILNIYSNTDQKFYGESTTTITGFADLSADFVRVKDLSFGYNDGMGNHYKILDGDNFFKAANMLAGNDKTIDLVEKAINNKWVLPAFKLQAGINVGQDFGYEGNKTSLDLATSVSTNIAQTSVDVSFTAEKELNQVLGLGAKAPTVTWFGKVDANTMLDGKRYVNAQGQVGIRVNF